MFHALGSPPIKKQAEWDSLKRVAATDPSCAKLHVFRLHGSTRSWSVARSFQDLRFFRQTLQTLYTSEVLNQNEVSYWPRRLQHVLRLPFPTVEWLPWTRSHLARFVAALVTLQDDLSRNESPTFLTTLLCPLLDKFLESSEAHLLRAGSEATTLYASPMPINSLRFSAPPSIYRAPTDSI
ncbi:hypothetical protein ACHHYP_05401 [Achlya hypogyna]|uniref:PX domain-containing protein n=1 Tax=Achlya hypogyna TaxID=1202772 RepID=A0A1V9ZNX7_ACHHY|nr:hypothetical protein ACHHYP_05401 [Achlya hypogyna]